MIAAKNAKVAKADWKTVKLGEIIVVKYGKDHKRLNDGPYPVYGSGGYMRSVEKPLTELPSLLIPRKGTLNNVMYSESPFWTVDTMFWAPLRDEKICDLKFVYYRLKLIDFQKLNVGSAVPSLTVPVIEEQEISLPPLPTQRKIAAVLGALDDKIENNRKICANLEAQAQALFKSWFVDFEPWGGKMPKDWKEFKLSDIAEFYGGYSYKGSELQESSCAMATIKNYERGGGFKLDGFKEIVPSEKLKTYHEVDLFDTIVAHTDLTQKAEVIGNAEMLLSKAGYEKIIMSMDLVKVLPKSGISKFLLGALLKNPIFKSHCLRYVNGTTVLHLSKMALQEYALYLPSKIDDLKNVEKLFEGVARKQAFAVNESRALAELRDALLPKLMSGELDVDDVEV